MVIPDDAAELDDEAAALRRELRRQPPPAAGCAAAFGLGHRPATRRSPSLGVPVVIMAVAVHHHPDQPVRGHLGPAPSRCRSPPGASTPAHRPRPAPHWPTSASPTPRRRRSGSAASLPGGAPAGRRLRLRRARSPHRRPRAPAGSPSSPIGPTPRRARSTAPNVRCLADPDAVLARRYCRHARARPPGRRAAGSTGASPAGHRRLAVAAPNRQCRRSLIDANGVAGDPITGDRGDRPDRADSPACVGADRCAPDCAGVSRAAARRTGSGPGRRPSPRPGRPRPAAGSSGSRIISTVGDEQLPCSARHAAGRRQRRARPGPAARCTTSRMRGPPGCTAQPSTSATASPCAGQQAVHQRPRRAATARPAPAATGPSGSRGRSRARSCGRPWWCRSARRPRRTPYPPAVRDQHHAPPPRRRTARAPPTCCGSAVGGCTCRLVSSTQSSTAGRPCERHVVGRHAEPGQRRVAAHVPDEHPPRVGGMPRSRASRMSSPGVTYPVHEQTTSRPTSLAAQPGLAQRGRRPRPCPAAAPRPGSAASAAPVDQPDGSSTSGLTTPCRVTTPELREDPLGQPPGHARVVLGEEALPQLVLRASAAGAPRRCRRSTAPAHHRGRRAVASPGRRRAPRCRASRRTRRRWPAAANRSGRRGRAVPADARAGWPRCRPPPAWTPRRPSRWCRRAAWPARPSGWSPARPVPRSTRRAASSTTSRAAATAASARPIRARTAGRRPGRGPGSGPRASSTADCATPT